MVLVKTITACLLGPRGLPLLALAVLLAGCGAGPEAEATAWPTPVSDIGLTATVGATLAPPSVTTPPAVTATTAPTAIPTTPAGPTPTTQPQPLIATPAPSATTSPTPAPPAPTVAASVTAPPPAADCEPTRPDALGPFYKPGAPTRDSVGQGYVLSGVVRAAEGCRPLPGAQVEFWLANDAGEYDDDHRATLQAGPGGEYRFESNTPPPYAGRPPHIHIRVSAPGLAPLVTQHYPQPGQTSATFDLVLPAR